MLNMVVHIVTTGFRGLTKLSKYTGRTVLKARIVNELEGMCEEAAVAYYEVPLLHNHKTTGQLKTEPPQYETKILSLEGAPTRSVTQSHERNILSACLMLCLVLQAGTV